jgi:Putative zinc-finger
MECNSPPPLTDEALSMALDELTDDETQRHLDRCPACAGRLAKMRQDDAALQKRLRRFECPSAQELGDYHAGMLDDDAAAVVKAHVEQCPRCQSDLQMLVEFLDLPPEETMSPKIIPLWTPKNVWRAARVQTSGSLALKGQDDETSHDMQAGSASVFLETKATPHGFALSGQVADNEVDWMDALIVVWQGSTVRFVRELDEMGEFHCDLVDPAPVTLYITAVSGFTVHVENLMIQA